VPLNEKLLQNFLGLDVPHEQSVRAMHAVASAADDAADCRLLLDMLGLDPGRLPPPMPRPREPKRR